MGNIRHNMSPYKAGSHIMTDDKAPVELLGMQIIERKIKNEVDTKEKGGKDKNETKCRR